MKPKILLILSFIVNLVFSEIINISTEPNQSFEYINDYTLNVKINTGDILISNVFNKHSEEFLQIN